MHRLIGGHASEFAEVDVTMTQAKVLYVVMAAGQLRLSELAGRLGIGTSSASEIVERLVELDLLDRESDPADRRQVVITTTPAAGAMLERFRELNQRQLRELLGRLDADELAVVDRAFEIFQSALDRGAPESVTTANPSPPIARGSTDHESSQPDRAQQAERHAPVRGRPVHRGSVGLGQPEAGAPARHRLPGRSPS